MSSSNFPRRDRNPNTDTEVEDASKFRIARQTIRQLSTPFTSYSRSSPLKGGTLPGTSWHRCRIHYSTNLITVTRKNRGLGSRRFCTLSTTKPTRILFTQYVRIIGALS